jgi:hypothetical protein
VKLNVLIGCESSGTTREAFRKLGHEAWSCDLLPADDGSPYHYQGDVFHALHSNYAWDLIIVHPPCTRLSGAGQWYVKRNPHAQIEQEEALKFTELLWAEAKLQSDHVALENPVGILSTRSSLGKPQQIIQPYNFGDDASKKTCLWLHNLPNLCSTNYVPPRMVNGLPRWDNQTDSGQNRLPPSADRWKLRSKTYQGIADAFAHQWSLHITHTRKLRKEAA